MKPSILLFFLMLSASLAHSQISSSDQKKLLKIIGQDFTELPPSEKYDFYPQTSGLIIDTSTTFKADTVGLVFNSEYVTFHDLIASRNSKELTKYLAPKPVTLREYIAFKNYVRDSITRMTIYFGEEEDELVHQFLKCKKWFIDEYGRKQEIDQYERNKNWNYFSLDWEKRFKYPDFDAMPKILNLYLLTLESFRNIQKIDERKLEYTYMELIDSLAPNKQNYYADYYFRLACDNMKISVNNRIVIANDNDFWAKSATHNFDELSVLSQIYNEIEEENPVVGVLGTQAKAYCNWKQNSIQKELNAANLPYTAVVTLPQKNDLESVDSNTKFELQVFDHTGNWKISQLEYSEFIDHVMDSISREALYLNYTLDKKALKLLNSQPRYLDEGAYEYVELDQSDRRTNRELFPFNYKTKIRKIDREVIGILDEVKTRDQSTYCYTYTFLRCSLKAKKYEYPLEIKNSHMKSGIPQVLSGEEFNLATGYYLYGRTRMEMKNELGDASGVRVLKKLTLFIDTHSVSIFPENNINLDEKSEELIPWLTYEQALAFYNWKYRIDKFNPKKESWQQFIFPSEEQFNAIQKGESIIIPEHTLDFPTPLFRYVVHVYPK